MHLYLEDLKKIGTLFLSVLLEYILVVFQAIWWFYILIRFLVLQPSLFKINFYIFHSTKYEKTLKSQKWQNIVNSNCIYMQKVKP